MMEGVDVDELLKKTLPLTERDYIGSSRITCLYRALRQEGIPTENATEIVVNTQCIYTRYYEANASITECLTSKDELAFIASFFLSLCIWSTPSNGDVFKHIMNTHFDKSGIYTEGAIGDSVVRVFTCLNGNIAMRPAIHSSNNNFTSDMNKPLLDTLLLWFYSYRYAHLIDVCYVRAAISIIAYDLEHSPEGGPFYCHPKRELRVLCQIIVTHLSYLSTYYKAGSAGRLLLDLFKHFSYIDLTVDCTPPSLVSPPPSSLSLIEHSTFKCVSVMSHRNDTGIKVYRGYRKDESYTIKRHIIFGSGDIFDNLIAYITEVSILDILRKEADHIVTMCHMGFDSSFGYIYMSPHGVGVVSFVKQNREYFRPSAMESLFFDMVTSLAICESHDILHNDIKPDNFIVEDGRLKLIDFGLSVSHFSSLTGPFSDNVQTIDYRAPELLLGDNNYTRAIDIWALACTMYEIETGRLLFRVHGLDKVSYSARYLSSETRYVRLAIIMKRTGFDDILLQYSRGRSCSRSDSYCSGDEAEEEEEEEEEEEYIYLSECPLWHDYKRICGNLPRDIYRVINWTDVSPRLVAILESCLSLVPGWRPSATKILKSGIRRDDSLF